MSNTASDFLIQRLNTATFWINHIFPILQIVFGTFGNVFNIVIFTRRTLRTNPCSLYFLAGSINNCFVIYGALLSRYLASSWNLDPSATNNVLCKLRNFFTYSSLTLALWFVALASIDRFLSSSRNVQLRQMSSLPMARKMIIITTIFISLSYVHILIYFRVVANGGEASCVFLPYEYIGFLSFFGPVVSCVLPILLMSIFGILTILNVRNRVALQINSVRNERLRSNDRQLVFMLLFQVIITTVISTPYFALAIFNAIASIILKYKLSAYEQAIYNFAFNLFRLLYYTNPIIAFYINTLAGPKFRAEIKRCIQYGLKSVLSATGLIRCLPLRVQQVVLGEIQMNSINQPMTTVRRTENAVHPIQERRPTNTQLI